MKTTSFEISKKLWENGFKGLSTGLVFDSGKVLRNEHTGVSIKDPSSAANYLIKSEGAYPYYDLETIINAIPKSNEWCFDLGHDFASYERHHYIENDCYLETREEDESLTDTAARLLILLIEKGVVKL